MAKDASEASEQEVQLQRAKAEIALQKQGLELAKREVALMAKELQGKAAAMQDTEAHQAKVGEQQSVEAEANGPAVAGITDVLTQITMALGQIAQSQAQDRGSLEQLLAIAAAPTEVVRHPDTGLVAGSRKVFN
jgi:hypothetical protein